MVNKVPKNFIRMAIRNVFFSILLIATISSCSNTQTFNIEHHIGLYKIVESKCKVAEDAFNPCENIHFVELVKGQFIGVKGSELAYVFWSGDPKIDPELQYASHLIKNHIAKKISDKKFWLNNDGESQEYFGFSEGNLTNYYVKYTTSNKDKVRIIQYTLKPVMRGNLPFVRLNYPGNK